jgi:nicotinamide riboside kinase
MAKKNSAKLNNIKIAFTGPESSGKTTMAKCMSDHFSCQMINEYARDFLSNNQEYGMEDLNTIAREQFKRNNTSDRLVVDTEMLVMKIWCDEKYDQCSKEIIDLLHNQQMDHYFLCFPDIPWEEDPLRENPNDRNRLFTLYEKHLIHLGWSYTVLRGSIEERKKEVIKSLRGQTNL